jgi:hypothetical protein
MAVMASPVAVVAIIRISPGIVRVVPAVSE